MKTQQFSFVGKFVFFSKCKRGGHTIDSTDYAIFSFSWQRFKTGRYNCSGLPLWFSEMCGTSCED